VSFRVTFDQQINHTILSPYHNEMTLPCV